MFQFNPEGKRTILSIDGGGMRGIIPLMLLIHLEDQTGKPAYELFDMVAGTSTGAIIAAALGLGYSARETLELVYKEKLPPIFGNQNLGFWLRYVFVHKLRYLYPLEPFHEVLAPLARNARIRDLEATIVLLTVKDLRTSNTYYIVNAGPGAGTFADWPVSGAVAASSAAVVFFPPVLGNLVDGGIGVYGNPCLAASTEAVEYIGFEPENTLHLSLGTGYIANTLADGAGSRYGPIDWLRYVVSESLSEAVLQQVYTTRAIYGSRGMDFRRLNPYLNKDSIQIRLGVDTGGVDPGRLGLDSNQPEEIALMERVGAAYAEAINWERPNVMPWETLGGHPQPIIAGVDWRGSIYDPGD